VINDRQATPIARDVPGVEIHAQLIEQILQGAFLVRPDWAIGAEILFTLLCGIGVIFGVSRIGALPSALLGAAAVATAVEISWLAFRRAQLLLDPVYPWAVITLVYLVASLLGYLWTEVRQREIRNAFSRYMSPHYVQELAAHPEKLVLGGESRTMTIMFSDIRGFTSLAEGMDARTLTRFMNSFLSPMTEIITEQKGTIDKYIGDCIMAFWNAPLDDPEHAQNAVRAAQAMHRKTGRAEPRLGKRGAGGRQIVRAGQDRHRDQHRRMCRRQFRLTGTFRLFAARRPGEPGVAAGRPGQGLRRRSGRQRGSTIRR
jgi:adenylate cyclase